MASKYGNIHHRISDNYRHPNRLHVCILLYLMRKTCVVWKRTILPLVTSAAVVEIFSKTSFWNLNFN